jgi:hypothetical protein
MKTNTAKTTPVRRTLRESLATSFLLATAALLLQGCTTTKPAWAEKAEADPAARSAFERTDPQAGFIVLTLKF